MCAAPHECFVSRTARDRTIARATRRSRRFGAPGVVPDDRDCPRGAHRRRRSRGWLCPQGAAWRRRATWLLRHRWSSPSTSAAHCCSSSRTATSSAWTSPASPDSRALVKGKKAPGTSWSVLPTARSGSRPWSTHGPWESCKRDLLFRRLPDAGDSGLRGRLLCAWWRAALVSSAMPCERDRLLECRAVGPAHRVRDQPRDEDQALRGRARAPRGWVHPLAGGQLVDAGLDCGP